MRDVGDRDDEPEAVAVPRAVDGVVEILRRFAVDGDERQGRDVDTARAVAVGDGGRQLARLLARGERELVRQIVLAQRDLDLHAGVRVPAEHFDHARDRLALRRRLLHDLDDDDVARLRLSASVVRHQQVLVDAAVLRDDESDAALVVEPADDGDVGARQDVDDLALGPAAPVGAGAARRDAVAVEDLVHLGRAEEEIRASVVRNEKPEPVRMPLHGAGDEVELRRDAELALAIHQQLAVAPHRVDAAHERVARAARDRHRARELGGRQRNAGLLQRVENRDPRRQ